MDTVRLAHFVVAGDIFPLTEPMDMLKSLISNLLNLTILSSLCFDISAAMQMRIFFVLYSQNNIF
jgi:hypothetical protein